MVESIGGLRRPDGGSVRVLGLDPQRDVAALRDLLGMQLQRSELPERDHGERGIAPVRLVLPHAGRPGTPARRSSAWPASGTAAFATLSGGERQRLSIASALIGRPRVAILDELTPGWIRRRAERPGRWWSRCVTSGSGRPGHALRGGGAALRPDRRHRRGAPGRRRHAGRADRPVARRAAPTLPPIAAVDRLLADLPEVSAVRQPGRPVEVHRTRRPAPGGHRRARPSRHRDHRPAPRPGEPRRRLLELTGRAMEENMRGVAHADSHRTQAVPS